MAHEAVERLRRHEYVQLDTAQVSGGCDAKAMSDQGRTSTSGITVTQYSKGTASADPVSQATRTVAGGSVLERLNEQYREAHGCVLECYTAAAAGWQVDGAGCDGAIGAAVWRVPRTCVNTDAGEAANTRRPRVWLQGRVTPRHWTNPTWFTQCCRMAHRASAPLVARTGTCAMAQ